MITKFEGETGEKKWQANLHSNSPAFVLYFGMPFFPKSRAHSGENWRSQHQIE